VFSFETKRSSTVPRDAVFLVSKYEKGRQRNYRKHCGKCKIELSSVGKMLDRAEVPPQVDALVEGPVISIQKSSVYIDLAPFGTGIIYGREFINAKDIIKKVNIGDVVKAKVSIQTMMKVI